MIRLFVALPVPEDLHAILSNITSGMPGVRRVDSDSYHITLRFIGEIDSGLADDLDIELARIDMPPLEIELESLGFFQKRGQVNNFHLRIRKTERLERLQRKVESACVRSGLQAEQRKFTPHITLARMKGIAGENIEKFIAEHGWPEGICFQADRFILYSSFLSGRGPVYTPEVEYDLKI